MRAEQTVAGKELTVGGIKNYSQKCACVIHFPFYYTLDRPKALIYVFVSTRLSLSLIALKKHVPLARYIYDQLVRHPRHRALEENYLSLLEDYLSESEAERVMGTVIEWARYAELFAYHYNSGVLSLENLH